MNIKDGSTNSEMSAQTHYSGMGGQQFASVSPKKYFQCFSGVGGGVGGGGGLLNLHCIYSKCGSGNSGMLE